MYKKKLATVTAALLVLSTGLVLGAGLIKPEPRSDVVGLPEDTVVEYGTVTVDAKWDGDQTRGTATVSLKTEFAEPPIVMANQYGRGGWHFFVHAVAEKDKAVFSVMLDRSFKGKEPKQHPCQIAYIAIGKRAK